MGKYLFLHLPQARWIPLKTPGTGLPGFLPGGDDQVQQAFFKFAEKLGIFAKFQNQVEVECMQMLFQAKLEHLKTDADGDRWGIRSGGLLESVLYFRQISLLYF